MIKLLCLGICFMVLGACARDDYGGIVLRSSSSGGNGTSGPVVSLELTTSDSLTVYVLQPLSIQLQTGGLSSSSMSFSCTGCQAIGMTFDQQSGLLSWTPQVGQDGTYPVSFQVTDGDLSATLNTSIVIQWAEQAPVFVGLQDEVLNSGVPFSSTIGYNEATGENVTVSVVSQLPPNASFDPNTNTFSFNPDGSDIGQQYDIVFELDNGDQTTDGTMHITVPQ